MQFKMKYEFFVVWGITGILITLPFLFIFGWDKVVPLCLLGTFLLMSGIALAIGKHEMPSVLSFFGVLVVIFLLVNT